MEILVADFWEPRPIGSIARFETELGPLRERHWLFRGQDRPWGRLIPSIDRPPREARGRAAKLLLEARSIDVFRQSLVVPLNEVERLAMEDRHIALMLLRHYDVPTRILDWSKSPYVAGFFASETAWDSDAEIWAFDERLYEIEGHKQWGVGPPVAPDR